MKTFYYSLGLLFGLMFISCSSDNDVTENPLQNENPEPSEIRAIDLSAYDNNNRVMMQAFYWDVEPRGEWWTLLTGKLDEWASSGIDRLWLPVATKGQSGGYSMGYDISDYFDFGEFEQHGTVETRFGSRTELETLIAEAHNNGLEVIADIVINHNSGGGEEYNPYRDKNTYTLFDEEHGNASGMFNRNYENFYPNSTSSYDDGSLFYAEQNLDHNQEYVQNWLWKNDNSVAKYYKNVMGFDGWRFDYVLGYEPWVVKMWLEEVGGFSVSELWDGNATVLADYADETGSGVFDFSTFYKLEEAMDRYNDLTYLDQEMLWKTHPDKAVTFTANHDTEKDENADNHIAADNKLKAYAYILTHPGYPTIFYSDFENDAFKAPIKQLIKIHNSIATGETEIVYADNDEYIMKRKGTAENPGLILYINTSSSLKKRMVQTQWNNSYLIDYTSSTSTTPQTSKSGEAPLEAPANGYAIWSIADVQ
ncbi:alpha-amylase [Galbibacter sp. EGI 63066]|uniref:alpha-amylase n=1 Tax=Galbibacter sp. EGI 63066 TaxID=2993559 RepID=UPI0022490DC4|nr:alpha-amylase [Galbibacter sp. EGI 63066]MCX2679902.1 alpha-amylase [Galbibacter sp. EGI 63066]